jgi:hypothetical protein
MSSTMNMGNKSSATMQASCPVSRRSLTPMPSALRRLSCLFQKFGNVLMTTHGLTVSAGAPSLTLGASPGFVAVFTKSNTKDRCEVAPAHDEDHTFVPMQTGTGKKTDRLTGEIFVSIWIYDVTAGVRINQNSSAI